MAEQQTIPAVMARTEARGHTRAGGISGDAIFKWTTTFFASSIIAIALVMVLTLLLNANHAITQLGFSFFTSDTWDPEVNLVFGARPFIFGTILSSLLALALAGLVGIGVAL